MGGTFLQHLTNGFTLLLRHLLKLWSLLVKNEHRYLLCVCACVCESVWECTRRRGKNVRANIGSYDWSVLDVIVQLVMHNN